MLARLRRKRPSTSIGVPSAKIVRVSPIISVAIDPSSGAEGTIAAFMNCSSAAPTGLRSGSLLIR
ncbi:hypothetical protein ACFSTI_08835 [Rhizorhabdus histidinilytica]